MMYSVFKGRVKHDEKAWHLYRGWRRRGSGRKDMQGGVVVEKDRVDSRRAAEDVVTCNGCDRRLIWRRKKV